MEKDKLLIIFAKNPVKGRVKTRLARDLGEENALEIYKMLLARTHKESAGLKATRYVYYSDEVAEDDIWNDGGFEKKLQHGNDLGERMENAFRDGFEAGFKKIVIIGTDLPDLKKQDLESAFNMLGVSDYVLGPAKDGGYYLFGMTKFDSEVFKNKKWSSASVLKDTLKDLKGKSYRLLDEKNDIDVLEDIKEYPLFQKYVVNDRQN